MESNIYYQLAQTECALDHYKIKLFKKNLIIAGLVGAVYILGKACLVEVQRCVDAKHKRDEIAEEHDKVLMELNQLKKAEATKSTCCDGYATIADMYEHPKED